MAPARATPRPFRFDPAVAPRETRYSRDGVGETRPWWPTNRSETVEHTEDTEHTESNE